MQDNVYQPNSALQILCSQEPHAMSAMLQELHMFQQSANVLLVRLAILPVHVCHLLCALHLLVMERNIVAMVNGLIVHQARFAVLVHA